MTIVRLGANVVSSSPAARQFFFIYIYICREVRQEYVLHLPMTPVWIEMRVLEVRHRAVLFFEDGAVA